MATSPEVIMLIIMIQNNFKIQNQNLENTPKVVLRKTLLLRKSPSWIFFTNIWFL